MRLFQGTVSGIDVIATPGKALRCLALVGNEREEIQVSTELPSLQSLLELASATRSRVEVTFEEFGPEKLLTRVRMLDRHFDALEQVGTGNLVSVAKPSVSEIVPEVQAGSQLYIVMLINMTDLCIELGQKSYNTCNEKDVDYFPVPKTCRTCSDTCEECHSKQLWNQVLSVDCRDRPFYLTLITRPDDDGNARGACWRITPKCTVRGGSICLG